jgi:hypothetical protein
MFSQFHSLRKLYHNHARHILPPSMPIIFFPMPLKNSILVKIGTAEKIKLAMVLPYPLSNTIHYEFIMNSFLFSRGFVDFTKKKVKSL